MSLPEASGIDNTSTAESVIDMDSLLSQVKSLPVADLFKLMKTALSEAEKKSKTAAKSSRVTTKTEKKAGSMPKGVVPRQLRKPRAWINFTLKHALEHGWEPFVVHEKRKDKKTGEVIEGEIEMPGSILHEGAWIYDGSVTEKNPVGKQMIHKDAMSLSKQRWAPKNKTGTHPELYEEFEASYVEEAEEVAETASVASSKVIVKKTAAEKEAEAEAKRAAKEEEKAAKKAEREAERASKKAAKEAEKLAKKAAKEEKDESKSKGKAPVPAAAVPAAAVKKTTKAVPEVSAAPKKKPSAAPKVATEAWSCPADGMVHSWSYKGKHYLRNSENEVWLKASDGGCGEWQGVYLPGEDRIDDSVEEPVFEE